MTRVGILSDTHAWWDDRYALYFASCDEIWHAGDIGNDLVADRLAAIAPLRAVHGNIDGQSLRRRFPATLTFEVEGLRVALNLTEEWDALNSGCRLITSGIMTRRGYAASHPEAIRRFLDDFEASAAFVNADPHEGAQLVENLGIVKAAVAEKAIPYCNIVCITGREMQTILPGYLETLLTLAPASIGGSLPQDDFYWIDEAN